MIVARISRCDSPTSPLIAVGYIIVIWFLSKTFDLNSKALMGASFGSDLSVWEEPLIV